LQGKRLTSGSTRRIPHRGFGFIERRPCGIRGLTLALGQFMNIETQPWRTVRILTKPDTWQRYYHVGDIWFWKHPSNPTAHPCKNEPPVLSVPADDLLSLASEIRPLLDAGHMGGQLQAFDWEAIQHQ
jgi:hypothetical protein